MLSARHIHRVHCAVALCSDNGSRAGACVRVCTDAQRLGVRVCNRGCPLTRSTASTVQFVYLAMNRLLSPGGTCAWAWELKRRGGVSCVG